MPTSEIRYAFCHLKASFNRTSVPMSIINTDSSGYTDVRESKAGLKSRFGGIIKFSLFLLPRGVCLHTITSVTARRDVDKEDRLESRSPPRLRKAGRYDGVRDRAMAVTRIHPGSLTSVCQAVA